jgi:hypothetical protein
MSSVLKLAPQMRNKFQLVLPKYDRDYRMLDVGFWLAEVIRYSLMLMSAMSENLSLVKQKIRSAKWKVNLSY